jgi:hypothetical protein
MLQSYSSPEPQVQVKMALAEGVPERVTPDFMVSEPNQTTSRQTLLCLCGATTHRLLFSSDAALHMLACEKIHPPQPGHHSSAARYYTQ